MCGFKTLDDVSKVVGAIENDHDGNWSAAREIAAQVFAMQKVVGILMEGERL